MEVLLSWEPNLFYSCFYDWLLITRCTLAQCFQDLSNSDGGDIFLLCGTYVISLAQYLPNTTTLNVVKLVIGRCCYKMVLVTNLVRCHIFFPESPCSNRSKQWPTTGGSCLPISYVQLVFLSSPSPQLSQRKRLRGYMLYPLSHHSPNQ